MSHDALEPLTPAAPVGGAAARAAPRRPVPAVAWIAALLGVAGLVQLLPPAPWDADTAYHVAVGRLIAHHGILRAFPWTPFSWLGEHYADKELLFHLLLAPLSGLAWTTAARVAGTLAGGALLVTLYLVLRREGVPRAGVWALVPLAASGGFVLRFALVRPHLLSVALAVLVVWAAARGRTVALLAASAVYPWCYVAWHLPLVLVGLVELARVAAGARPGWRPLAAAAGGIAAGVLLHPNAANLLRLWWLVHVEILGRTAWAGRAGFALGQEFQPYGAGDALRLLLVPALMTAAALVLALRRRREDALPLAFAGAAAAFLALTLASSRFVEYLAPFSAVALGLALGRRSARVAVPALAAAFAFTALLGAAPVRALTTRGDDLPPPYAAFLQRHVEPGAQVFTCEWGLTGELMLALPDRRFLVALDPVLMHARDPELHRLWHDLPGEGPPDAAALIRSRFGARYVLCAALPGSAPLFRRLRTDPEVRTLLESPLWYLYDLGPDRTAPALGPGAGPPSDRR